MEYQSMPDGECVRVPLSALKEPPWGNVRRSTRSAAKRSELKRSIEDKGILQAITVRPTEDGSSLEVLAGNGRWEISQEIGLADIPAVIKHCTDKEGIAIGYTENSAREDLTLRDEIEMSQECVSHADGDYEEAARVLGWDERKVRARIKLNQCSETVLTELGRGRIKLGHAEVLCQFTHKLQEGTLEKILSEQWTVDYLKERANGAARALRHARFDTNECNGCPHNSTVQSSLFDNHIGEGKCTHLPCFREKTEAWLESYKRELEHEEGVVLIAIEKPESDRRTVSEATVGTAFQSDCLGCVSRVRILQDGINRDCGDVIDHQCINLSCYNEKVDALKPKEKTGTKKKASKNDTKPSVPAGVKQQAQDYVRGVLGSALLEQATYSLAITLHSVARATGYDIDGLVKQGAAEEIAIMIGWDTTQLQTEIQKAIAHGTLSVKQGASFDGVRMTLRSKHHVADRCERVIQAWRPTKEWLETYQKGAIESFCRDANIGFDAAWDELNGKGGFNKLMKKKKGEIIEAILEFDFDWAEAAPKEVLELVG